MTGEAAFSDCVERLRVGDFLNYRELPCRKFGGKVSVFRPGPLFWPNFIAFRELNSLWKRLQARTDARDGR